MKSSNLQLQQTIDQQQITIQESQKIIDDNNSLKLAPPPPLSIPPPETKSVTDNNATNNTNNNAVIEPGLDEELTLELNELKRNAMKKFKKEKYNELNEQLKQVDKKDKKTFVFLTSEIKTLQYDPTVDEENIMGLEDMQKKFDELVKKIEEREEEQMSENTENSMLCELTAQNLINFLKHFKIEINFGNHEHHLTKEMMSNIETDKEQLRILNERCFFYENEIKNQVNRNEILLFLLFSSCFIFLSLFLLLTYLIFRNKNSKS